MLRATGPDGTSEFSAPNRPPTADAGGPYAVDEGSSVSLNASGSTDPDQHPATLIFEWDYDGVTFDVDVAGVTPLFDAFNLDGPISVTVAVRVTDEGLLSDIAETAVKVENVDPTVTAFDVPSTGQEGSPVAMVAEATDPAGANDPLTFQWTVTRPDGSMFSLTGASASFVPQDDGIYPIDLFVEVGDSGSANRRGDVAVANVAPTPSIVGPSEGFRDLIQRFTLSAIDPSTVDQLSPFTFAIDWDGDGVVDKTVTHVTLKIQSSKS